MSGHIYYVLNHKKKNIFTVYLQFLLDVKHYAGYTVHIFSAYREILE